MNKDTKLLCRQVLDDEALETSGPSERGMDRAQGPRGDCGELSTQAYPQSSSSQYPWLRQVLESAVISVSAACDR